MLALAASCRGFFVNPTLQSITVTPSTGKVAPAGTIQMTATGTFDDGSTSNVTSNSSWQSSDTTVATSWDQQRSGQSCGQHRLTARHHHHHRHRRGLYQYRNGHGLSGGHQHHGNAIDHESR